MNQTVSYADLRPRILNLLSFVCLQTDLQSDFNIILCVE